MIRQTNAIKNKIINLKKKTLNLKTKIKQLKIWMKLGYNKFN